MILNKDKRFDIDLAYGVVFEQAVADMLQHSKIEVKTERDLWIKSNNIVIETSSRGKPSGISTTEAEYWFHNLVKDGKILTTLVFPVNVLQNYIKEKSPRVVKGGDDGTSLLYLINLTDLFKKIGE